MLIFKMMLIHKICLKIATDIILNK